MATANTIAIKSAVRAGVICPGGEQQDHYVRGVNHCIEILNIMADGKTRSICDVMELAYLSENVVGIYLIELAKAGCLIAWRNKWNYKQYRIDWRKFDTQNVGNRKRVLAA